MDIDSGHITSLAAACFSFAKWYIEKKSKDKVVEAKDQVIELHKKQDEENKERIKHLEKKKNKLEKLIGKGK